MTSRSGKFKQITLRLPMDFWKSLRAIATEREAKLARLVTEAVAEKFDLPVPELRPSGYPAKRPRRKRAAS